MKNSLKFKNCMGFPLYMGHFFILPFYFILKTPTTLGIVIGIILNVVFSECIVLPLSQKAGLYMSSVFY